MRENETYALTKRDKEIMDILWKSANPLTAAEIVRSKEGLNIHTVQASLKKLLHKHLIEIADIVYSGTVLCRNYRTVISAEDYEIKKYVAAMKELSGVDFSLSRFIASLLVFDSEEKELAELKELEKVVKKRQQEIRKRLKEEAV